MIERQGAARAPPTGERPLQSGKHAAVVLEEALDAGFHGAMIGTQPKGLGGVLDDPDLTPFWEVAHAKKATLFIHPMYGVDDDRPLGSRTLARHQPFSFFAP